jgi:hypothetical protein
MEWTMGVCSSQLPLTVAPPFFLAGNRYADSDMKFEQIFSFLPRIWN